MLFWLQYILGRWIEPIVDESLGWSSHFTSQVGSLRVLIKRYTHWSIPIHQIGVSTCIYRMFIFNCHGCPIGTPISKPCFQEPVGTPWVLLVVRCGWHLNQWAPNPIATEAGTWLGPRSFQFQVDRVWSRHMWLCPKIWSPIHHHFPSETTKCSMPIHGWY
jgi:hypothetical protein